jgi:phytanoyl-CoA hydroxylase
VPLTPEEIEQFHTRGYLILNATERGFTDAAQLARMQHAAEQQLVEAQQPLELETTTGYPGAPDSTQALGGNTVRRLLGAHGRHRSWQAWATNKSVVESLAALFGDARVVLNRIHHNCLMTKNPRFSSATGWHQDIRYWAFDLPELISVWLALGNESGDNGGLRVVPGSHRLALASERFDQQLFLDPDRADNAPLLAQAVDLTLAAGEVLFFHCKLLHSAAPNHSTQTKYALVFTYHDGRNGPIPGSRSAALSGITLAG